MQQLPSRAVFSGPSRCFVCCVRSWFAHRHRHKQRGAQMHTLPTGEIRYFVRPVCMHRMCCGQVRGGSGIGQGRGMHRVPCGDLPSARRPDVVHRVCRRQIRIGRRVNSSVGVHRLRSRETSSGNGSEYVRELRRWQVRNQYGCNERCCMHCVFIWLQVC